jgi:RimJ/RimL family protein N-acetyltransferase
LNSPELTHYLSSKIPLPYTEQDAQWWVEKGSQMGITRAIDINGELAGCIGAIPGDYEYCKSAEIGYWLAQNYWGNGLVLSALNLLIDEVAETTDIVRIHATVFDGNLRSGRVLEKAGFSKEGELNKAIFKNGQFFNAHIYGKVIS